MTKSIQKLFLLGFLMALTSGCGPSIVTHPSGPTCGASPIVFTINNGVAQSFSLPADVNCTTALIKMWGAGGAGGYVTAKIVMNPSQTYTAVVGGGGQTHAVGSLGGINGGGQGSVDSSYQAGGGGGQSEVLMGGTRILIAGVDGGGGNAVPGVCSGGPTQMLTALDQGVLTAALGATGELSFIGFKSA